MGVLIHSSCGSWRTCCSSNVTASAFSSLTVETASNASAAVTLLALAGWNRSSGSNRSDSPSAVPVSNVVENVLVVQPAGDANNHAKGLRIWGWNRFTSTTAGLFYYEPIMLLQVQYTCGNIACTALGGLFLADTIILTTGDATSRIYSPGTDSQNDIPGQIA